MMKWVLRVLAVAVFFSAGYAVSSIRDYQAYRLKLAEEILLRPHTSPPYEMPWLLIEGLPQHQALLRNEYEKVYPGTTFAEELAEPWSPTRDFMVWGIEYSIFRNPTQEEWSWRDGTPDAAQNDMVRYLCFRLKASAEKGGVNMGFSRYEFEALATYPNATLVRNAEMIADMLKDDMASPYPETVRYAAEFLAAQVADKWALDFVNYYLKTSFLSGNPVPGSEGRMILLRALDREATRNGNEAAGALYKNLLNDKETRAIITHLCAYQLLEWKQMLEEEGLTVEWKQQLERYGIKLDS